MEFLPDDVLFDLFTRVYMPDVLRLRRVSKSLMLRVGQCDTYWSIFLGDFLWKEDQHDSGCFRHTCFPLRCTSDFLYLFLESTFPNSVKPFFVLSMSHICAGGEQEDLDSYRDLCGMLSISNPGFYPPFPCHPNGKPFDYLHTLEMVRRDYVKIWKSLGIKCRDPQHFGKSFLSPLSYGHYHHHKNAFPRAVKNLRKFFKTLDKGRKLC